MQKLLFFVRRHQGPDVIIGKVNTGSVIVLAVIHWGDSLGEVISEIHYPQIIDRHAKQKMIRRALLPGLLPCGTA